MTTSTDTDQDLTNAQADLAAEYDTQAELAATDAAEHVGQLRRIDLVSYDVGIYVGPSGRHYTWLCHRTACELAEFDQAARRMLGSKGAATRQAREHVKQCHTSKHAAAVIASLSAAVEQPAQPEVQPLDTVTEATNLLVHRIAERRARTRRDRMGSVEALRQQAHNAGLLEALVLIGGRDLTYWTEEVDAALTDV